MRKIETNVHDLSGVKFAPVEYEKTFENKLNLKTCILKGKSTNT